MQGEDHIRVILKNHLPAEAIGYCLQLWLQNPFTLTLARPRFAKVGDFSIKSYGYYISVNRDLSPFQFLITYIHEVAHLQVHQKAGRQLHPHGDAWRNEFKALLTPLLTSKVFPLPLLERLVVHMQKPRASTFSDAQLTKELRQADLVHSNLIELDNLTEGSLFKIRGRCFKKGKLRRTRFYCSDNTTNRKYLVSRTALVELIRPAMI